MSEFCYCCFVDLLPGEGNPGEARWKVGDTTVVSEVVVCTVCRRLGCEVLNPDGCKKPEAVEAGDGLSDGS